MFISPFQGSPLCKNHVAIIHTVEVSKPSDVMNVWYRPHGGGYQVEMIKIDRNNPFCPIIG